MPQSTRLAQSWSRLHVNLALWGIPEINASRAHSGVALASPLVVNLRGSEPQAR